MSISTEKVLALEKKFPGTGISGGPFWGYLAYVNTPDATGMLMISGSEEGCKATIHTAFGSFEVTETLADKLLDL